MIDITELVLIMAFNKLQMPSNSLIIKYKKQKGIEFDSIPLILITHTALASYDFITLRNYFTKLLEPYSALNYFEQRIYSFFLALAAYRDKIPLSQANIIYQNYISLPKLYGNKFIEYLSYRIKLYMMPVYQLLHKNVYTLYDEIKTIPEEIKLYSNKK